MPTSHWVSSSYDVGNSGDTILPPLDVDIPPGATAKRMVIRGTAFTWQFRTDFWDQIYPLTLALSITSLGGAYFGRLFYRARYALRDNVTSWRDPITIQDTYLWYGGSGDRELGLNHPCSYGRADGVGFTIRAQTNVVNAGPFPAFPDMRSIMQFSVLYIAP